MNTIAVKVCKKCQATSDKSRWVVTKNKPNGLLCHACKMAVQSARRQTPEGAKNNSNASIRSEQKRLLADPLYYTKQRIRHNIIRAIQRNNRIKQSRTQEILGCTYEDFLLHLGCPAGLPDGVELDHIIPLAVAYDEETVILLNHYTNFQLLSREDNVAKSDYIAEPYNARARDLTIEQRITILKDFKFGIINGQAV